MNQALSYLKYLIVPYHLNRALSDKLSPAEEQNWQLFVYLKSEHFRNQQMSIWSSPGHSVVQVTLCTGGPSQKAPPFKGAGLVQLRVRRCQPRPQRALHSDHSVQEDQPPLTETHKMRQSEQVWKLIRGWFLTFMTITLSTLAIIFNIHISEWWPGSPPEVIFTDIYWNLSTTLTPIRCNIKTTCLILCRALIGDLIFQSSALAVDAWDHVACRVKLCFWCMMWVRFKYFLCASFTLLVGRGCCSCRKWSCLVYSNVGNNILIIIKVKII